MAGAEGSSQADAAGERGGSPPWRAAEPQMALLYQKAFGGDVGAAQAWFDQRVLDKYRGQAGFRVMRTNTVGRVRAPAGWSLDFGIADGDELIHAALTDLAHRLPPPERQHWATHLITPPASRNFIIMRLGAGSCMDDGELRSW